MGNILRTAVNEIVTELQKFVTADIPPNPPDPPPVRRPRSEGTRDQERRRQKRVAEIRRVSKETGACSCGKHGVTPGRERKRRRRLRAQNSNETEETDAPIASTKNELNRQKISDGDIERVTSMSFPTLPSLFRKFKKPTRQPGKSKPTKDFLHQAEQE